MKRKRKHIPLIEIAASALADKLPVVQRAALRALRVPARTIRRMFTPDHVELHAWDGSDKWWNLDMRLRDASLKAKDAADTARAAKVKRNEEKWRDFLRRTDAGKKPLPRKSRWPKRRVRA